MRALFFLAEKPSKWRFQGLKESKLFKGKERKARKPSSSPIKINQEILVWLKDSRLQISVLDLENSPNLKFTLKILKQAENSFISFSFHLDKKLSAFYEIYGSFLGLENVHLHLLVT